MQARHDQNSQAVLTAISTVDGVTITPITVDPTTGGVMMDAIGEVLVPTDLDKSRIDQNDVNTIYGVSDVDGTTLVPIRTNNDGYLLITI